MEVSIIGGFGRGSPKPGECLRLEDGRASVWVVTTSLGRGVPWLSGQASSELAAILALMLSRIHTQPSGCPASSLLTPGDHSPAP